MLITKKDILNSRPPFLLKSAAGEWLLIEKIQSSEIGLTLSVIEKVNSKYCQRTIELDETPFHVGADVWELNYGATIVALEDDSLRGHAAIELWQEWVNSKKC
jgi:hypothetical protein